MYKEFFLNYLLNYCMCSFELMLFKKNFWYDALFLASVFTASEVLLPVKPPVLKYLVCASLTVVLFITVFAPITYSRIKKEKDK